MKSKASFVIVFWWLFLMLMFGVSLLLFADKEERVSHSENRTLSGFPELSADSFFSGEFASGFESYLSDGVFGRDDIVGVSEGILRVFNANTDEDTALLDSIKMDAELQGIDPNAEQQDNSADSAGDNVSDPSDNSGNVSDTPLASDSDLPEIETEEPVELTEIDGYGLFLEYSDGGYYRHITYKENALRIVSEALNCYLEFLPEDGHVFYTTVPLTQNANFLTNSNKYCGWYENVDVGMEKYIADRVHVINTPAILEEDIMDGKHVYFGSDHHWTPRGAIKVVNECMRIQGVPTVSFDEYSYKTNIFVNNKLGTKDDLEVMYPLQNTQGYLMTGGEQARDRAFMRYDLNSYMAYLSGDARTWTKYITGFSTGRKALVIGDSFSNTFTPYLAPYYDEVHKTDARYHNYFTNGGTWGDLIKKYGIDDVYIVVSYANGPNSETSLQKLENNLYGY